MNRYLARLRLLVFLITALPANGLTPITLPFDPLDYLNKVNFEPSSTSLEKYGLSNHILDAVPLLEIPVPRLDEPDRCTGFYVSDQGHLMTAGHCIFRCLEKAKVINSRGLRSKTSGTESQKIVCHIALNGQPADAEVLAFNSCALANKFAGSGCQREDYALLRVQSATLTTCLALSDLKIANETQVVSVGYPGMTLRAPWRADAMDSNGRQQYISIGKVIAPMPFCRVLRDGRGFKVSGRHYFRDDKYIQDALAGVASGQYIQTLGADLVGGNSGGPLIDIQSGSAIGIATFTLDKNYQNDYSECAGSTIYTTIQSTLNAIRRDYPDLNLSQVLACRNPVGLKN